MKYKDLTTVECIDRDEMSKVLGGLSFGEFLSSRVPGIGRGNLVKEFFGISVGQAIQFLSDVTGYPGTNAGKSLNGVDMPAGLIN